MSLEKIQPAENLDSTTQKIKKTINDIAHSFNYIGLLLWEVKEHKYYLEKGYNDVFEYAEKELMFKKTSTHNFIKICERFSLKNQHGYPTMALAEKYDKYSYTQLSEMLSIKSVDPSEVITPDMSKKKIREVKKQITHEKYVDVEFKEVPEEVFGEQIDIIEIIDTKEYVKVHAVTKYEVSEEKIQPAELEQKAVEPITKQKLLDYMNKRIVDMKDILKSKYLDDEMKYRCLGQIDAFQSLYEEVYNDFEKNTFF